MDEQQTMTPECTSLHQSLRPRANIPLPRELRDKIYYGYLLEGKHTKVKRARIGDYAYKFHRNVIGVNHQIHDEASDYFFKYNGVIVVSHQFLDARHTVISSWVPMVTELHQTKFLYRSLNVHLSETPYIGSTISRIPKRTWLFLLKDLDSYCLSAARTLGRRVVNTPHLRLHQSGSLSDHFLNTEGQQ